MTETQFTAKLRKELARLGATSVKLHGGSFQRGLPDLLVGYKGKLALVEVKLDNRNLTPVQRANLQKMTPSCCIRVKLKDGFFAIEGFGEIPCISGRVVNDHTHSDVAKTAAAYLISTLFLEHEPGGFKVILGD